MTIKYEAFESYDSFSMIPETPSEVADILRLAQNAKKCDNEYFLSFSNNPYLEIRIAKVSQQITCLTELQKIKK